MNVQRIGAGLALLFAAAIGLSAGPASLVDAAKAHDREAVRALLKGAANVNQAAPDGATALHWAVQNDDAEMVAVLLKAGADARAVNRYGVAPLSMAAINGNVKVMQLLLEAGAPAATSMPEGETAL